MHNIRTFSKMKRKSEKIVMITAYDYPSGKYVQAAGADMILVGDSLGMVVLGYPDTLKVTMEDIIHHSRACRRGADDTFIVADLPFMSYHLDLNKTKENASRLILQGNADAVKLEGGNASRVAAIAAIVDCEIPVVAHLGLTPQSVYAFGGYRVQGKKSSEFARILQQAKDIEQAGAFMLVLEGIPEELGKAISETLAIPTIGIGAGRYCDGQVLVYHDLLGMTDFVAKFVKEYENVSEKITSALSTFCQDVKSERFPEEKHIYNAISKKEEK
ncbi:MAG: 3-methyl-2-oxobutanoate hydroxymethyltransferase [Candidatus Cloacimonadales bacterium]